MSSEKIVSLNDLVENVTGECLVHNRVSIDELEQVHVPVFSHHQLQIKHNYKLKMFKQGVKRFNKYSILAWEPSAAQFTKSYPRRLPALIRFLTGN